MENGKIESIIKMFRFNIASAIYPEIPMGNGKLKFTVRSVDGEYEEKINSYDLSMASALLVDAIGRGVRLAMIQAAMRLSSDKNLRAQIINRDADDYYESDGHYEIGLTREKNRERFGESFPTPADFKKYYREMGEKI